MTNNKQSIVFLGATGAVGSVALERILSFSNIHKLLLLGRKTISLSNAEFVTQEIVDITDSTSYEKHIRDFDAAVCTLGVGEPSKMSKEDFVKIDKTAVLDFATNCKNNGVKHFQLLSSVGINSSSNNFFLRTKGELVDELIKLNFERLSIFQPSMILTPTNRYGFVQALTLAVWPKLNFLLLGGWRKYRGILVDKLGKSIANNLLAEGREVEYLDYDDFLKLNN